MHADRTNLDKILRTCEEMLRDRGCHTVTSACNCAHAVATTAPVLEGERDAGCIKVFIGDDDKVGVKYARSVFDMAKGCDVVIVSSEGPTPFTRKEYDNTNVTFMLARDLCFNVTRHALVPKHEVVVSLPEGLTPEQLPKILNTDPIVVYYDWPIGTVIRVRRRYAGHEPIVYFRCVTES